MLDRFLEAGGNFVDTADTYSDGGVGGDARAVARPPPRRGGARDQVPLPGLRPGRRGARAGADRAKRATRACGGSASTRSTSTRSTGPIPGVPLEDDPRGARRAGPRRQGARARRVELPRLAARLVGRAAGPRGLGAVRLAAAAVLARRALDRDRAAAVLPCRRARRDPVGAARRRLPEREVQARRAPARGQPDRRGGRDLGGGLRAARDRAQLPRRRRGGRDRRGARRDDPAGRARLAARDRGRDRADHRAAHVRAARGRARRRRARARRARSARAWSSPPGRRRSTRSGCCASRAGSATCRGSSERAEQPLEVGVVVPRADRRAHQRTAGMLRTTTPAAASRSRVCSA